MATVELPSGNTADLVEPEALTAGVKLAVQRAVSLTVRDGQAVMSLAMSEEMKIAALVRLVKSWSLPVAVTAQNIENLAIKDYNALSEAVEEHMKLLRATPDKSDAK